MYIISTDVNSGGTKCTTVPPLQILGGTRPPRPPVVYAPDDIVPSLTQYVRVYTHSVSYFQNEQTALTAFCCDELAKQTNTIIISFLDHQNVSRENNHACYSSQTRIKIFSVDSLKYCSEERSLILNDGD